MKLPAKLKPERLTAIVDTREQTPLDLTPLQTEAGTLPTGDYSLKGLEHVVAIERKSLSDLLGCVGRDRERFDKEVQRLLAYPTRALVVESTWEEIEGGEWRAKLVPSQVLGALLGWISAGLPVIMTGTMGQELECTGCGCIARMTRKSIDEAGLPTCACGGAMVEVEKEDAHARAGTYTSRLLYTVARRRWREARELVRLASEVADEST